MLDEFDINFISQTPDITEENLKLILTSNFEISEVNITKLTGYDDLNFLLEKFKFVDEKKLCLKNRLICLYGSLENAKSVIKFSNPIEACHKNLLSIL